MRRQRLYGFSVCVALVILASVAACRSNATTVKFVREVAFRFPTQGVVLSSKQIDQLFAFATIYSAKCLTPPDGGVVVTVEALLPGDVAPKSRLLAESRAATISAQLVRLGFEKNSIYQGTSALSEMRSRKSVASALAGEVLDDNTVVVEMVCDPMGP